MSNWIIYSIGFLAQLIFSGRLILQWILSEKSKKVLTPSLFWKLRQTYFAMDFIRKKQKSFDTFPFLEIEPVRFFSSICLWLSA